MSPRTLAYAVTLAAYLTPPGSAQLASTPLPAPSELLAGFGVVGATVQDLTLPAHADVPFQVRFSLAGIDRTMFLVPHDVRSADFQLLLHEAGGLRRLPTPRAVTLRGTIGGVAGAVVAAALIQGQLHATIHLHGDGLWGIEPISARNPALPRASHIVYRAGDLLPRDARCGLHTHAPATPPEPRPGPAALRIAELAVDADVAYYGLANNDPTLVHHRVTAVINGCNVIYRRDCEIEHSLTAIVVRTTNVYSWNGDLCGLLSQFGSYWNTNHQAIRRDLAHLFTGQGSFSGVVGCANLGVLCTGSAYGVSKAYSDFITNVGLVAHELGHNWNAPHCDAQGTCNIMCSSLGGCSGSMAAFEPYSANIIIAHRDSRTCLGNPVLPTLTAMAPTTVTAWTPAAVELTGTGMDSVTSVTMGGQNVNYTLLTPTTIRFTPRAPFAIGTHPVVVANSVGASNPLDLTVSGNHPSVLDLSPVLVRNYPLRLTMHSDVNWVGLPLLSFSNVPSTAPGIVSLGIGNGFLDLIQLHFLVGGSDGAGWLGLTLPPDAPNGLVVYAQLLTFDPANITLPLEVSNVVRSTIY